MTADRQISGDEFAQRGRACFGHGWRLTLGQAIDVSNSTISRWCSSGTVPVYAVAALELAETMRRNGLDLPRRFDRHSPTSAGDAEIVIRYSHAWSPTWLGGCY